MINEIDVCKLNTETPEEERKYRVGNTFTYDGKKFANMLCYVDARYVQDKLDEVVGPTNWSSEFIEIKGNLFCKITITFQREDGKYDTISKMDCGVESNVEKEKGEASDAFKRAAVMLGIGRDLYDLPNHFVMHADLNEKGFPPKDWTPQGWGDHNHNEQRHVQATLEPPSSVKPQPPIEEPKEPAADVNPVEEKSDLQQYADEIVKRASINAPDEEPEVETSFVNQKPKITKKDDDNKKLVLVKNLKQQRDSGKATLFYPRGVEPNEKHWTPNSQIHESIRMMSGFHWVVIPKWLAEQSKFEYEAFDPNTFSSDIEKANKESEMNQEEAQADQNEKPNDDDFPF